MNLVAKIKLICNTYAKRLLLRTIEAYNRAVEYASQICFESKVFSLREVHNLTYRAVRNKFGFKAQMAVRVVGKVVETFKIMEKSGGVKNAPKIKLRGAMFYDEMNLKIKPNDFVQMQTSDGLIKIPYQSGGLHCDRLKLKSSHRSLIYSGGEFYVHFSVCVPEERQIVPLDFIGVDLGVVNIASDSFGNVYSGKVTEKVRRKCFVSQKTFQRNGTRGAKRRLKRISKRESRFRRNQNHEISKKLVTLAKGTCCGIGLENLTGIHNRITVGRSMRRKLRSWGFLQLRNFIEYKAKICGVPVVLVDPRNTSRTCSNCGHCEKLNRKTRSTFICRSCGHSSGSDLNASLNIRDRARLRWLELAAGSDPNLVRGV